MKHKLAPDRTRVPNDVMFSIRSDAATGNQHLANYRRSASRPEAGELGRCPELDTKAPESCPVQYANQRRDPRHSPAPPPQASGSRAIPGWQPGTCIYTSCFASPCRSCDKLVASPWPFLSALVTSRRHTAIRLVRCPVLNWGYSRTVSSPSPPDGSRSAIIDYDRAAPLSGGRGPG